MNTVTGSLCKPLCVTKEVQLKRCLGHAVKLHVLEAEWNGLKVILKTSEYFGHEWTPEVLPHGVSEDDFKLTTAEFVKHVRVLSMPIKVVVVLEGAGKEGGGGKGGGWQRREGGGRLVINLSCTFFMFLKPFL